jgi:hypothetical protein
MFYLPTLTLIKHKSERAAFGFPALIDLAKARYSTAAPNAAMAKPSKAKSAKNTALRPLNGLDHAPFAAINACIA